MYKVFINEKSIILSKSLIESDKNIEFEGTYSIEMAIDLLENSKINNINIFGKDESEILESFYEIYDTIEAAGGIVENEKGQILFIFRLGKWDLPKGKLEAGETIEEGALREVEEETGLTNVILGDEVGNTFHLYKNKNTHIIKKTYWYKMKYLGNEIPVPQTIEGITKVEWKEKDSIEKELFSNTFENIKIILKNL